MPASSMSRRVWKRLLERASRAPVVVRKAGRPVVVVIPYQEFERFQTFEDAYWGERAMRIRERGEYIGVDESAKLLRIGLQEGNE